MTAKVATEQRLCRGGAEANNYFRVECGDFGVEPRPAGRYFCCIWFFVNAAFSSRFPLEVFCRVGDVNLFAVDACFRKRFIQEVAGGADKRFAFQIFLIAWLFADKNNSRSREALAEHGLRGMFSEIAGLAVLRRCF